VAGRAPIPVAIALGSNLGDRLSHVSFAVERLREQLSDLQVSSWHETKPVGVGSQPTFLHGALTGLASELSPRDLLGVLLGIERERGRERPHAGAPRTLDLDLILYGDVVTAEPGLRIPHPRFRDRLFVLEPLAEIAADWRDPETGRRVEELLHELRTKNEGRRTKRP
jgi:2-amino-4-hydroxy-6-hydroxymethyldihydropteridine diphosphokinase